MDLTPSQEFHIKKPVQKKYSDKEDLFYTSNNFAKDGKFFIYDSIGDDFPKTIIAPFIREIEEQLNSVHRTPLQVFINSPGGNVDYAFELISLFELANKNQIEVWTYVYAEACSAASFIAVCGNKRFVSSRASHLLHFARGWDYAHNPEMVKRNQQFMDFLQKEILRIYKTKTKLTDLEAKLLADNFRINGGKDLIKFGLADYSL